MPVIICDFCGKRKLMRRKARFCRALCRERYHRNEKKSKETNKDV